MTTKLEEAFAQHGIQVAESDGAVHLALPEAYELLGYLELMHGELYKRGLCANGSPTIPGDEVAPLAVIVPHRRHTHINSVPGDCDGA